MPYELTIFDALISMRSNFADMKNLQGRLIKAINKEASKHKGFLDLSVDTLCKETKGGNPSMNRFLLGDIENLVDALKQSDQVTRLNLSGHNMGDAGAKLLVELLKNNSRLLSLYIKDNQIKDEGAINKYLLRNQLARARMIAYFLELSHKASLPQIQNETGRWMLRGLAVGGVCVSAGALTWPVGLSMGIVGGIIGGAKAVLSLSASLKLSEIVDGSDGTNIEPPNPLAEKSKKEAVLKAESSDRSIGNRLVVEPVKSKKPGIN